MARRTTSSSTLGLNLPFTQNYLHYHLVPSICQRTNHSKEAVERYIRDFEAVKLLDSKFDDINTISLITRLSKSVVNQYLDLLPIDN